MEDLFQRREVDPILGATKVAVIGLGKIGLPLAVQFAAKGARVTGCDIDSTLVALINAGDCPFEGEPGLAAGVRMAHYTNRLSATTDTTAAVAESDVVVVIVRVGIDEDQHTDFSRLDQATDAIGRGLRPGTLVVLETTMPVGATRNHFGRRLQDASGLAAGAFHLAYSPERVTSGAIFKNLDDYPKIVGGVDAASGEAAAAFYRRVLDAEVMLVPDAETAEFSKLAESVYRDLNIALANELAKAAESLGVDYAAAAKAANSQPYSHLHTPGVGVGGHCIPVYPYFFLENSDGPLIALGREVNDSMAAHAAAKLEAALDGSLMGKTVLILGLAYRGGVKEAGHSSTLLLAPELERRGATVLVHDPLFSAAEIVAHGLTPSELPPAENVDAVVLQAMHAEYGDFWLGTIKGCKVFLDGRGGYPRARVEAAGLRYIAIGQP